MPGGSSGGTSSYSNTSTTNTDMGPWSGQQPFLTAGWNYAKNLLENNPLNAPINQTQQQALAQISNMGLQPSQTIQNANGALNNYVNGSMLSPDSNPYLSGMFNAAAKQITDNYQTATAPQTASNFETANRYGSGAAAQAQNQNQLALGRSLGDLANNMYGQAYQQGTQQQLQAAMLSPALNKALYENPTAALNAGDKAQSLILGQQMQPWQTAALYQGLIGPAVGQSGTSTTQSQGTQTTPYYSNAFGSAFGGLLGLGGLAGNLGWQPFGAGAASGGGLFSGGLGGLGESAFMLA